MQLPQLADFSSSIWSILPPLVALSLAIMTRRVLVSLGVGIVIGAIMLNHASTLDTLKYLGDNIIALFYSDGAINADYVNIILFLILLGIVTALLTISGSTQAFVIWAQQHIKTKRQAKLFTVFLGIFIFIDDYFNSLAVGAISRPITDKYKVSRAKLAYLLDSTAAPICVITPISSWGAYIITLIAGLLATHAITDYTPMGAFMAIVGLNFYAVLALIMVLIVAYFSFDIGPMKKSELHSENHEALFEEVTDKQGRVIDLILPILVLILATIAMMIYTGYSALASDGLPFSLLGAFENTTVGISLVVGGVASLITATLCVIASKQVSVVEYITSYKVGIQSMLGAIFVLLFAWTINTIIGDMQTGKYLASLVDDSFHVGFLPTILFVLATVMAFSTGTSWGTFGIMLPIAAAIAVNAEPALLLPCLSAVMAGAVCGDHCSPISDTTILSSTGARCNHIEHVTTQLPYTMLVAIAAIVGYLAVGFTFSGVFGFIAALITMLILVFTITRVKSQK